MSGKTSKQDNMIKSAMITLGIIYGGIGTIGGFLER